MNIYELDELIVKPEGRPMVFVHLVWCIYDGKAELRGVASDRSKALRLSKLFRELFKSRSDGRGRMQVRIDEVEVDHGFGACMTSLDAHDLDPKLEENRQKYIDAIEKNEKQTKDYLAMVRKKAEKLEILRGSTSGTKGCEIIGE